MCIKRAGVEYLKCLDWRFIRQYAGMFDMCANSTPYPDRLWQKRLCHAKTSMGVNASVVFVFIYVLLPVLRL